MRTVLVSLALTALACDLAGCGSTASSAAGHRAAAVAPHATASGGYRKDDADADADERPRGGGQPDDDRHLLAAAGRPANAPARRAIATAVQSYYAAAAAGDGPQGCALLAASLAAGLAQESGDREGRRRTCAGELSLFFDQQHGRFAADTTSPPRLVAARVRGDSALAVLRFTAATEEEILLAREGGVWRIDALSGSTMP
jgi:hypothetical protein